MTVTTKFADLLAWTGQAYAKDNTHPLIPVCSQDREPPVGSVVRDGEGDEWQRQDDGWLLLYRADEDLRPYSWGYLCGHYSPIELVSLPAGTASIERLDGRGVHSAAENATPAGPSIDDLVLDFHRVMGASIGRPIESWAEDRLGLLREECAELEDAVLGGVRVHESILRELADIAYIVYGTAIALGYRLDPAIREVHRANMSKLGDDGKPILRERDGKVLKGKNFRPPDMFAVLDAARLSGKDGA